VTPTRVRAGLKMLGPWRSILLEDKGQPGQDPAAVIPVAVPAFAASSFEIGGRLMIGPSDGGVTEGAGVGISDTSNGGA
jgi:hypothetical protein